MNRASTAICLTILLCATLATATAARSDEQEPTSTAGKVTRVTLYRGQALITRAISLSGTPGSRELIVTDLPPNIVDGSLFAEAPDKIVVRAVRLLQRAVG